MERKHVEKTEVLKCRIKSSLKTLVNDIGNCPNELMEKSAELGLEIVGDQLWRYQGSDGNPDTQFTLDICIPVKESKGDPGKFQFETLPAIDCLSEIHKGPWMKLGDTYGKMMGEIARKGIASTSNSREIYLNCDFENQENCITEVQIELQ